MGIKVVITGASGLVGRNIVEVLSGSSEYDMVAAGFSKEKLENMFGSIKNVECISNSELLSDGFDAAGTDYVIHCAFTRKNDPAEITAAVDLTSGVYKKFVNGKTRGVIGISTRSVYKEPDEGELNTEESPICPNGLIGTAKYACELMLSNMCALAGQNFTILRLGSVNELKTTDTMVRPMNVFVDCMLEGKPIHIVGGSQVMSYIAPQDIASAVLSLLKLSPEKWADVYNVGTGWICTDTLLNIARRVRDIGAQKFGVKPVEIEIEERQINQRSGQDITRLSNATGWTPKWTLDTMICDLYSMKTSGR